MYVEELNIGEVVLPDFEFWKAGGIYSRQLGVKVAPEDLWVMFDSDKKKYFTAKEARELEEKILIPNGWRLLTDDEWHLLLEEFGTKDGETNHKLLMARLGLVYGGYVKEENVEEYNYNPHNPNFVHNLGNTGCYGARASYENATSQDTALFSRYFYFLKDRDPIYGFEYVGTCGSAVCEAYLMRCVAVN